MVTVTKRRCELKNLTLPNRVVQDGGNVGEFCVHTAAIHQFSLGGLS